MEIKYEDLNLQVDKTRSTFTFGDTEIEYSNYLPASDKYDLIMVTLQKSFEDGYYNAFKLNMYFDLHLVYLYTNIVFSKDKLADEARLYDELVSCGFIAALKNALPQHEIQELQDFIYEVGRARIQSSTSAGGVIQSIIQDLPKNAQKAIDLMKEINPDQFKELMDMANSLKGGKPIN